MDLFLPQIGRKSFDSRNRLRIRRVDDGDTERAPQVVFERLHLATIQFDLVAAMENDVEIYSGEFLVKSEPNHVTSSVHEGPGFMVLRTSVDIYTELGGPN